MKQYLWFLSFFLCAVFCSGCFYSRTGSAVYQNGLYHCYGNPAEIRDMTLFRTPEGADYIALKVSAYSYEPKMMGLIVPRLGFADTEILPEKIEPEEYAWFSVPQRVAEYLTAGTVPKNMPVPAVSGLVWQKDAPDLKKANKIPVLRKLCAPVVLKANGGTDTISDAAEMDLRRSFGGWCCLVLTPGAYIADIPLTVVYTVIGDVFIIPSLKFMEWYGSLLGFGTSAWNIPNPFERDQLNAQDAN